MSPASSAIDLKAEGEDQFWGFCFRGLGFRV